MSANIIHKLNLNRISGAGLALCVLYIAATAACVVYALYFADTKEQFVWLKQPIEWQLTAINAAGVEDLNHGWGPAYAGLFPPTLVALYFLGWLLELVFQTFMGFLRRRSAL